MKQNRDINLFVHKFSVYLPTFKRSAKCELVCTRQKSSWPVREKYLWISTEQNLKIYHSIISCSIAVLCYFVCTPICTKTDENLNILEVHGPRLLTGEPRLLHVSYRISWRPVVEAQGWSQKQQTENKALDFVKILFTRCRICIIVSVVIVMKIYFKANLPFLYVTMTRDQVYGYVLTGLLPAVVL